MQNHCIFCEAPCSTATATGMPAPGLFENTTVAHSNSLRRLRQTARHSGPQKAGYVWLRQLRGQRRTAI